jgi:hypothetical protein
MNTEDPRELIIEALKHYSTYLHNCCGVDKDDTSRAKADQCWQLAKEFRRGPSPRLDR